MSDAGEFTVLVGVRGYETDAQGHVNQSVYLQYAEHARWQHFQAAGITQAAILAAGTAPVVLELNVRFKKELRAGEEVTVSCVFEWSDRSVYRARQTIRKADGTIAAELSGVGGVLDMSRRTLVTDPVAALRKLATDPAALGLPG
ncbi:acyl-CoA thioesterase [Streptomyces sp. NPDC049936]|uniref:acyl-CoA thioesterase n=1 Tax=Streptomyces sp. NPDC049936 TaxID=3365599 RepID=UPI00379883E5